jgi:hypothetical protein
MGRWSTLMEKTVRCEEFVVVDQDWRAETIARLPVSNTRATALALGRERFYS